MIPRAAKSRVLIASSRVPTAEPLIFSCLKIITAGFAEAIACIWPSGTPTQTRVKIKGSAVGTREEAIKTLDFAARGIIDPHVTVANMDDNNAALETTAMHLVEDTSKIFHVRDSDMRVNDPASRVVIDMS
jgi:hypothetical protein